MPACVATATCPTIASASPLVADLGAQVTITGTNFTDVISVQWNDVGASEFVVHGTTEIVATVPDGAESGALRVTTRAGTAAAPAAVTVERAPRITGFAPPAGSIGSSVVISGANFLRVSSVTFGGVQASFTPRTLFELAATVPAGAATGEVVVTAAGGSATSAVRFVVTATAGEFAQGMVSLTFDDGASQYPTARPALNAAGLRGTFYVITGGIDGGSTMTTAQLLQLVEDGHEIGSHTVHHPRLTTLTAPQLTSELADSRQWLIDHLGVASVPSFAYPYGVYDDAVEAQVRQDYESGRAFTGDNPLDSLSGPDVHRNRRDGDRHALGSYPTGARYGSEAAQLERVKSQVDAAIAERSWLVLVFHDVVASAPSDYGVTQAFLSDVASYLRRSGAKVVTVREGAGLMSAADARAVLPSLPAGGGASVAR